MFSLAFLVLTCDAAEPSGYIGVYDLKAKKGPFPVTVELKMTADEVAKVVEQAADISSANDYYFRDHRGVFLPRDGRVLRALYFNCPAGKLPMLVLYPKKK